MTAIVSMLAVAAVVLAPLLASTATVSSAAAAPAGKAGSTLWFGDSISVGLRDLGNLAGQFNSGGCSIDIDALSGRSTLQGVLVTDAHASELATINTVVVALGANDAGDPTSVAQFPQKIQAVVVELRKYNPGVRIFWVTPTGNPANPYMPGYYEDTVTMTAQVKQMAAALNFEYLDWHAEQAANPLSYPFAAGTTGFVHYADAAYTPMAGFFAGSLGCDGVHTLAGPPATVSPTTTLPPIPPVTGPGPSPVPGQYVAASWPVLRIGSTGEYVRRAQSQLTGYGAPVTGTFDQATYDAVVAFQRATSGLDVTGTVDWLTGWALGIFWPSDPWIFPVSSTTTTTTTTLPTTSTTAPSTIPPTTVPSTTIPSTTSTAGPTTTTAGQSGAILSASMSTAGIPVAAANNDALKALNTYTISAWVKPNATTGTQSFISRAASPWADQAFLIGANNGWLYTQNTTTGTSAQVSSGGTVPAGQWTHVAATFDGSTLSLYVNGVLAGSKASNGSLRLDNPSAQVVIGGQSNSSNTAVSLVNAVNGIVAPAAVWSRARTAAEIAAEYAAGQGGTTTTPTTTTAAPTTTTAATTTTSAPTTTTTPATTTTKPATTTTAAPTTTTRPTTTTAAPTTTTTPATTTTRPATTTTSASTTTTVAAGSGSILSASMIGATPFVAPITPALTTLNRFTVSAWVKMTSTTGSQAIIARAASPWADQAFYIGTTSGWLYASDTTSTGGAQVFGGGIVPIGTWTHVAATFDGSNFKFYVNGTLVATKASTGTLRLDNPSAPVILGARSNTSASATTLAYPISGTVSRANVWNTARTATDITNDYKAGPPP